MSYQMSVLNAARIQYVYDTVLRSVHLFIRSCGMKRVCKNTTSKVTDKKCPTLGFCPDLGPDPGLDLGLCPGLCPGLGHGLKQAAILANQGSEEVAIILYPVHKWKLDWIKKINF